MPADWKSFIDNVSKKIESQDIKDSEDFANFISDQYLKATVDKAQSPFGNVHKKGSSDILVSSFARAFKMLESETSPTLEEKESDPMYADLEEKLPETSVEGAIDQIELDFRDWTDLNKEDIEPFKYSQFFSQFPGFPKDRSQTIKELSRKLISQFSRYNSVSYIEWLYSLKYGTYSDWGSDVLKEIARVLIEESGSKESTLNLIDVSKNLDDINITERILQVDNSTNPERVPDYLTKDFIVKFSYSPSNDSDFFKKIVGKSDYDLSSTIKETVFPNNEISIKKVISVLSDEYPESSLLNSYINANLFDYEGVPTFFNLSIESKRKEYDEENERYRNLRIKWIEGIANSEKPQEDPVEENDPYHIMARGIIDYWKSTLDQPLSSTPPVFPALIVQPQGGKYIPVYYGSQKNLANYLRRSFNTGKKFKRTGEITIASKLVSTAIAFSFAMHLLELKFIYRGGIPTAKGPTSMIGFVPLVF